MSLFDSAAFAGLLSSLSGTLAGFAVSGLVFVVALLARDDVGTDPERQGVGPLRVSGDPDVPLALLTSAFVGLILSSLAYALMAGEPAHSPRLATEQVIAGAGFGTGGLILLLALRRLVCGAAPSLNRWMRHVVGIGAPCVVWLYLAEGTRYVATAGEDNQRILWSVVGLTAVAQVGSAVVALLLPRRAPMTPPHFMRFASVGVVIPTVTTLCVALTPTLLPNDIASPMWALYTVLAASVIGTSYFTLHVGRAVTNETVEMMD